MARNYAALPYDYLEEMEALNDAEFGRLTRALLVYSMTGEQLALCGNERFYAKRVMAQEDRFKASYDDISTTRREAGKAGAAARWQNGKRIFANGKNGKAIVANGKNGNTETNTETKTNTNTQLSNDSKGDIRAKRFTPPTLAEVQSYVAERHSPVDPQEFIDFYESKGWMVGKTPMKNWKAACRNAEKWERWAKAADPKEKTPDNSLAEFMRW
jgi:hypothetical protein|nr:MAG TPA: hypothetical protein [Caudoviricetes sp.]DAJ09747.1 MAG TPA: hypothetical protein [Caudoviricetes sp.]DAU24486.1 MAG TPA: hypothetical protein [Caudoviricetes sp.]